MNREDIIRIARMATNHLSDEDSIKLQGIVLLALDTGAAAEREACAKVCQDRVQDAPDAHAAEAILCAAAIRARGRLQEDQKPG